jgi:CubicO group peptidase (beta-lactamase class C family)
MAPIAPVAPMASALTAGGLARLDAVMAGFAERDEIPGLAWLVSRRGEVHTGTAGTDGPGGAPVAPDTIFRISSTTKPITAVAAMVLVEECRLRLDDPVDELLPELADRRVVSRSGGPVDDTVPARRPITLRDLLTFRLGLGSDFTAPGPSPVMQAMTTLGVGEGPPQPAGPPPPDEWMRRIGSVPLAHQPGERWLYHTGADVLGVLIARASGQPLGRFMSERVLEPLGMVDTGFWVPEDRRGRFGACFTVDPATGGRVAYDLADGQWASPPAFPSGGAGLVSTLADLRAFGEALLAGGTRGGERVLSRASVAAMTTNQLTPEQVAGSSPSPDATSGWGLGLGVELVRRGPGRTPGTYFWDGGLGSSWAADPAEDLVGVLLTNQTWMSPVPPAAFGDFWTCVYAALD